MRTAFRQDDAQLRFDWGLAGALAVTESPGTAAVVVDVLSFSTTVSVAGDLGVETLPFPWRDDRAAAYAESVGARLAGDRRQAGVSLSPASIRTADPQALAAGGLVLPSPNGSSICFALASRPDQAAADRADPVPTGPSLRPPAGQAGPVLVGCLRNASAVADWLAAELLAARLPAVGLVAAGERWPDGTLRPAVEDLWGAGAILARIASRAPSLRLSPEATAAAAAFVTVAPRLAERLAGCASGRELIEDGFALDVAIAAELDSSIRLPVLDGGRFRVVRG